MSEKFERGTKTQDHEGTKKSDKSQTTYSPKVCLKKIGSWHIFVCSSLCIHAMEINLVPFF